MSQKEPEIIIGC